MKISMKKLLFHPCLFGHKWSKGNTAPVFVHVFFYNSDCCESAAVTISIHKTKKGAEMAKEFHKAEKLKEWENECKEYPPTKEYPFDFDQWWGVRERELLP